MDSVLTAPLGLRLHRNTLTRQDAVVVPTRLGLVRLRRGGSEHLPGMSSAVAGVSSVRLLAPPEVSVRPAVLEDRRQLGAAPPGPGRACCPRAPDRTCATSSSSGSGASAASGGGHAGSRTSLSAASRAPSRAAAGARGVTASSSAPRRASRSAPSGTGEAGARCQSSTGSVGSAAWNRELGARLLPLLSVLMAPRDGDVHAAGEAGEEEEGQAAVRSVRLQSSQGRPRLTVTSITVPDMASARVALHQRQRQQRARRTTRHASQYCRSRTPAAIAAAAAAAAAASTARFTNTTTQTTSSRSGSRSSSLSSSNSSSGGSGSQGHGRRAGAGPGPRGREASCAPPCARRAPHRATGSGRRASDSATGSHPATTRRPCGEPCCAECCAPASGAPEQADGEERGSPHDATQPGREQPDLGFWGWGGDGPPRLQHPPGQDDVVDDDLLVDLSALCLGAAAPGTPTLAVALQAPPPPTPPAPSVPERWKVKTKGKPRSAQQRARDQQDQWVHSVHAQWQLGPVDALGLAAPGRPQTGLGRRGGPTPKPAGPPWWARPTNRARLAAK
ncbi:mucin-5AC-like isoform X2 [Frankliniella occidentalis]|nr:mucin-5AC-like isoform X2 [Frankliniella occidentalis]XP_052129149.1 mucin-5AC-like isoform X2 [Frankliniella occidentalis]